VLELEFWTLLPFQDNNPQCSNLVNLGNITQPEGVFFDFTKIVVSTRRRCDIDCGCLAFECGFGVCRRAREASFRIQKEVCCIF
jgi:hypothetical protein